MHEDRPLIHAENPPGQSDRRTLRHVPAHIDVQPSGHAVVSRLSRTQPDARIDVKSGTPEKWVTQLRSMAFLCLRSATTQIRGSSRNSADY
jgi:hypothetical protein